MTEVTTNSTENVQQQETKWFVLRVVSGKEKKVKEYLDKEISRGGWGEVVKQVRVGKSPHGVWTLDHAQRR